LWIGRSSFGLEYRVRSDGGPIAPARLVADGASVQVMWDLELGRVERIPAKLREAIEAFEGRAIPWRNRETRES
jgi:acyl-CoA thioesterase FadM